MVDTFSLGLVLDMFFLHCSHRRLLTQLLQRRRAKDRLLPLCGGGGGDSSLKLRQQIKKEP
jgi:hypothetical protein